MASLQTSLRTQLRATLTDDVGSYVVGPILQTLWQYGTAIDQMDLVYSKRLSIVNGAPTSLDLSGSLLMPNGSAAVFAKVGLLWVMNRDLVAQTTHILSIGGGSNALAWLPSQSVGGPGAEFYKKDPSLAGLAVTAATADILTLTSAAGTIPVDVLIIGRSA